MLLCFQNVLEEVYSNIPCLPGLNNTASFKFMFLPVLSNSVMCPVLQMKYKVPPFHKKCLSFLGFSHDEQNHMEEITIENGNIPVLT